MILLDKDPWLQVATKVGIIPGTIIILMPLIGKAQQRFPRQLLVICSRHQATNYLDCFTHFTRGFNCN